MSQMGPSDLLTLEGVIRSVSFLLVIFSLDTIRFCKRKPWLAVAGLVLLAIYYINGMFTGDYLHIYIDIALIMININLILMYRKVNYPAIKWLKGVLHAEAKDPGSPITEADAEKIILSLAKMEERERDARYV